MKNMFFLLVALYFSGCTNMPIVTLTIYNASQETLFLESVEGIHLFEPGSGPQNFGGKEYSPNHLASITSFHTAYIDQPIKVIWLSGDKKQRQAIEIGSVKKLPRNPIDYDGNILLVFETNLTWSATFMAGDTSPPVELMEKLYMR